MPPRSDDMDENNTLRNKIIGLGEKSIQKSYFPELQRRLMELERFRALLDQSTDCLFLLNLPAGRIEDVTLSTCRQLGYERGELIGRPFELLTSTPEMVKSFYTTRCDPPANRPVFETDLLHKDGHKIPVEVVFSPVTSGNFDVFVTTARDITERKDNEEVLRQLNASLEQRIAERTEALSQAVRQLESFSYSISHDLRAPLRTINGYSHLLEEEYAGVLDEVGQGFLTRIQEASLRMADLIDGLLKLSRTNSASLQMSELNMSEVARAVQQDIAAMDPARQVEWIIPAEINIVGDPVLIRTMLENLFLNAWKFTSHHPTARIELGETAQEGQRVFFVRDDGAGFNMSYVDKLFKPFNRLHNNTQFEGTGIGLSIVAKIVQRHGGRLWAESVIEQGATFYFTLAGRTFT